jgi:hypothetical protein
MRGLNPTGAIAAQQKNARTMFAVRALLRTID